MKILKRCILFFFFAAIAILLSNTGNVSSCISGNFFPFSVLQKITNKEHNPVNNQEADYTKDFLFLGSAAFAQKKSSGAKVTFVELGSVNCIPCKKMQPVMRDIEKKYKDQVKVVFHDVWTKQGEPYAKKFGIRVIPTQVFLDRKGAEFFRHEGYFPFEEVEKVLKKGGVR